MFSKIIAVLILGLLVAFAVYQSVSIFKIWKKKRQQKKENLNKEENDKK